MQHRTYPVLRPIGSLNRLKRETTSQGGVAAIAQVAAGWDEDYLISGTGSVKRCDCPDRAPFLSVFIVLVSPASVVKPH